MAKLTVVFWRDIPAQVTVRTAGAVGKALLGERFQQAIDRAAMRAQMRDTDAYLEAWRNADPVEVGEDVQAEADRAAAAIEAEYTDDRLEALVRRGGLEG